MSRVEGVENSGGRGVVANQQSWVALWPMVRSINGNKIP